MRHWGAPLAMLAAVGALVAVPVVLRRDRPAVPPDAAQVIVITPNNEQIRQEFGDAFARWHLRTYGTPAAVVWNTPGGAGDIRRLLEAGAVAALRDGRPVGGDADLLFGGGSYEYERLKRPIGVEVGGTVRAESILEPVVFDQAWLDRVYGRNEIAGRPLYDPDGAWFGCALSAFGIVSNRDVLARLAVPEPADWSALADPRLQGWVALVNPAQSASVATAMETILLREGWDAGWAILRRAAGNARSIAASGTAAPIEVAQGDAAMAIAIDFYGRFQQQAVADGGSPGRMAYIDPMGKTAVDADPIAMLRGAPHPETARRFIEFALSREGQLLWQLPPGQPDGPAHFGLRRLPASRAVYASDGARFVDRVDPWAIASAIPAPDPDMRAFVAPLFVAMAVEDRALLREAWRRIAAHPGYPRDGRVLRASDAADPRLRAMLEAFDAMPAVPGPDGASLSLADPAARAAVARGWLRGEWKDRGLWAADDSPAERFRACCAAGIAANLRRVIALDEESPR